MFMLWAVEFRPIFKAQEISQEKYDGRQKDSGREATQKIAAFLTGAQWTGAKARPRCLRQDAAYLRVDPNAPQQDIHISMNNMNSQQETD